MKLGGWAIAGLAVLGVVAASSGGSRPKWKPSGPTPKGAKALAELAERGGLTSEQIRFLTFVAYGESGLDPLKGLGDPSMFPAGTQPNRRQSEADRALAAYNKPVLEWLRACGNPEAHYALGSVGLFAMLPAYAMDEFKGTELACVDPLELFDPAMSIAAAYGFATGLTRRTGYQGTIESLRSGWGWPGGMDNMERIAKKTPKWRRHLEKVGQNPDALKDAGPEFPQRDLVSLYRSMGGTA